MSDVNAIPEGCNSVNAYLTVPNSKEALEFYAKALGAEPGMCMPGPDGQSTMHAEILSHVVFMRSPAGLRVWLQDGTWRET